ncbi:hypothetical protein Aple_090360 [Acrocarpospora pleiomorpha]|uniref:Uncharacterized protein n=1 Tax=Acrocarpospora pleiomorpha TaxID=90975 RepID=A0A5M3XYD0_9ACTN|nr:hypothetical protein [Acrocarpospora pleiomorpha]GES26137.1 hypothetical protein Aple_090360 [Acrocarpospora pleiomorpha]
MPVDWINRNAGAVDRVGVEIQAPDEAVEAMIAFEQRYGGLGVNGMEYGLDGEATVYCTAEGWAFPGIWDGDWTWGVEVLLDGRAGITLADKPLRILNRSIDQRLEAHALLAAVRHWPHLLLELASPQGIVPVLAGADFPSPANEASGPADLWWFDGVSAVHLRLNNWWTRDHDVWIARCFSKEAIGLSQLKELLLTQVIGSLVPGEVWCSLCCRFSAVDRPCS